MVVKPYQDEWINHNKRIRSFNVTSIQEDFIWHQDRCDREITILNGDNWKLQYDNELPIILEINKTYYIPRNTYHRIIKGSNNLIIVINEDMPLTQQ